MSLFVQNAGMKLFAAKGKVEIQAQSDADRIDSAEDGESIVDDGEHRDRVCEGNIVNVGRSLRAAPERQHRNSCTGQD